MTCHTFMTHGKVHMFFFCDNAEKLNLWRFLTRCEDSDLKTGFIPYFELFHPFSCNLLYFEQRVGLWWVHLLAKHAKPPRRVGSPPGHPQHPQISGRRKCAAWFWLGHRVVDGEKIPTASWFVGSFLQQASTPLKTNIVLEKGPRQKKTWSFNHQFSGDIIVFREVVLVSSIWHFRIIKFSLQQQSHMWPPCHLPNFSRFYQLCGKKNSHHYSSRILHVFMYPFANSSATNTFLILTNHKPFFIWDMIEIEYFNCQFWPMHSSQQLPDLHVQKHPKQH